MKIELSKFVAFEPLKNIISFLKRYQIESYFVGGAVRDFFIGRQSKDFDIVFLGMSPYELKNLLSHYGIEANDVTKFLTFRCELQDNIGIDFAHARKETYPFPGSLPEVYPTDEISIDLKRRDFTINAIALQIFPYPGVVVDPFGGFNDLKRGVVRVIKKDSFLEDPTRAFRAIRYKQRFKFKYSSETISEWENACKSIKNISFDRIKLEFKKIVHEPNPVSIAEEIARIGLINSFDDRLRFNKNYAEKLKSYTFSSDEDWMMLFALFVPEVDAITGLSLTKKERKFFSEIFSLLNKNIPLNLRDIHPICKNYSDRSLRFVALIGDHKELMEYIKRRKMISLEIDGTTIMRLGVPQSDIGKYLDELIALKIAGELKGRDDEIAYIKRILSKR